VVSVHTTALRCVCNGHRVRMMHRRDYPVVETADVLLAALERAHDAVVIVDGDLRIRHFNAAAELIWGQDRANVLGRHVSHLGLGDLQSHPGATPG
jgi:PAS domain-containing protein